MGKAGAYPSGAPKRRSSVGLALSIAHKHETKLERLSLDKHSSLLRTFVNYEIKIFITLGPEVYPIKLFTAVIYKFS